VSGLRKAVVLARGLGTRMRRAAGAVGIDERQARAADTGVKAMIPVGRPFLDYVIGALADAGFGEVCLVIGPEHDAIRHRYTREVEPARVRIAFAVQHKPLGTANAVVAAEPFVDGEPFLTINSDNYYPVQVLEAVRRLQGCGLAGFDRAALVRDGNIDDARVRKYALLQVTPDRRLEGIVEKPDEAAWTSAGEERSTASSSRRVSCRPSSSLAATGSRRGPRRLPSKAQMR